MFAHLTKIYWVDTVHWGFPGGTIGKEPAWQCKKEMQIHSLGREDPLAKGMETHSSILACRIPWSEQPGRLPSTGSQRVSHNWSYLARTHRPYARHCAEHWSAAESKCGHGPCPQPSVKITTNLFFYESFSERNTNIFTVEIGITALHFCFSG